MFNIASDIEFLTSGPISKLAGNGFDDEEFQGSQQVILSGFQRFADTALLKQADVKVNLNHKVKKITWKVTQN